MLSSTIEICGTDGQPVEPVLKDWQEPVLLILRHQLLAVTRSNVYLGDQYSLGLSLINPSHEFTITGNPSGMPGTFGLTPGTDGTNISTEKVLVVG
ncbi:MAG: hypothetical protein GY751_11590 [Bacteroidetes bacterium]|nr:hypothetical protein [Bacteroidota bacterium]